MAPLMLLTPSTLPFRSSIVRIALAARTMYCRE